MTLLKDLNLIITESIDPFYFNLTTVKWPEFSELLTSVGIRQPQTNEHVTLKFSKVVRNWHDVGMGFLYELKFKNKEDELVEINYIVWVGSDGALACDTYD